MKTKKKPKKKTTSELTKLRKKIVQLQKAEKKLKKLAQEFQHRSEDLNLISALNSAVNRGDDLPKILDLFGKETGKILSCDGVTAYLLSEDGKYLVLQKYDRLQERIDRISKSARIEIPGEIKIYLNKNSLYRKILVGRKPKLINNVKQAQKLISEFTYGTSLKKHLPKLYKLLGIQSVISVPLIAGDKVIGLLDISRKKPFTESEIKRLTIISKEITTIFSHFEMRISLRRNEELIQKFVDAATEGFVLFDSEFNIIAVNDYILKIFEVTRNETIGRNLIDASPGAWETGRYQQYENVVKTGIPYAEDDVIVPEEYGSKHLAIKAFKVGDGLGMILRDITRQKMIENNLRSTNERLEYLIASTSAVIYASRPRGDYGAIFVSDNVSQMLGYETDQFLENPSFWIDHVHPKDTERIMRDIKNIYKNKYHSYEYRFRCKDGSYIWLRDEMKLVEDEDGKPLEIIGILTDITYRKKNTKK